MAEPTPAPAAPPASPAKTRLRKVVRRLLGVLVAAGLVLVLAPASLLVVVAETRPGRWFGGVALFLAVAFACLLMILWRPTARVRPWATLAILSTFAAAFLADLLIKETPGERPNRDHGLQSRFEGKDTRPRYSPWVLLPEVDQVKLGVTLVTRFVPWVDRASTIRSITMGLYREIQGDPDASGLKAVTHYGALELVGADFAAGHYFAYVPRAKPGERLGVVVFLHGNGGNFQLMPWAWREFAESQRCLILCPTFGFGFWGKGGVEAVDRAFEDASRRWTIDPGRVYLGGISDGGVGVTRSAAAHPGRYRGLIYVSPTMHLDELSEPAFARDWAERPVLIFQGGSDWSVYKSRVDPAVDLLRRQGTQVDYRVYPDEDHFLFFSRRGELMQIIGRWMGDDERPPALPNPNPNPQPKGGP